MAEPEANVETSRTALNQADIDNYIKIWPAYLTAAQKGDLEAINAAYAGVGWERERGDYVFTIINAAFLVAITLGAQDALLESMPANIRPGAAEIGLVAENLEVLQKAYGL